MGIKRKGSALLESIASTVIMGIILSILASFLVQISSRVKTTKDIIFLTNHNTNIMERIRQMPYENDGELLSHYGTDILGSNDIESEADVITYTLDNYKVYKVNLKSKTKNKGAKTTVKNTFYITNIGDPNET